MHNSPGTTRLLEIVDDIRATPSTSELEIPESDDRYRLGEPYCGDVPVLIEILRDAERDGTHLLAAANALGDVGKPAVPALIEDEILPVRLEAAKALEKLGVSDSGELM